MKAFTVYETSTGKILSTGKAKYPLLQGQQPGNTTLILFSKLRDQYIDISDGSLKTKTESGILVDKLSLSADGVDKITVSNIPTGTLYQLGNTSIIIDDGIFEFTTDTPNRYFISFSSLKYIAKEVTIDAS